MWNLLMDFRFQRLRAVGQQQTTHEHSAIAAVWYIDRKHTDWLTLNASYVKRLNLCGKQEKEVGLAWWNPTNQGWQLVVLHLNLYKFFQIQSYIAGDHFVHSKTAQLDIKLSTLHQSLTSPKRALSSAAANTMHCCCCSPFIITDWRTRHVATLIQNPRNKPWFETGRRRYSSW